MTRLFLHIPSCPTNKSLSLRLPTPTLDDSRASFPPALKLIEFVLGPCLVLRVLLPETHKATQWTVFLLAQVVAIQVEDLEVKGWQASPHQLTGVIHGYTYSDLLYTLGYQD